MEITKIFTLLICVHFLTIQASQEDIVLQNLAPEDLQDWLDEQYYGDVLLANQFGKINKPESVLLIQVQSNSVKNDEIHHKIIKKCINSSIAKLKSTLIKYDALIKEVYLGRASLLHYVCARTKDLEVPKYLLEEGLDIEAKDTVGASPLHWACKNRNLKMFRFLIDNNASVKVQDNAGNTPLHWAYRYGALEIITLLLELGSDGEALNRQGYKPSQIAAEPSVGCCVIL